MQLFPVESRRLGSAVSSAMLSLCLFGASLPSLADETCQSPDMVKIVGQEGFA